MRSASRTRPLARQPQSTAVTPQSLQDRRFRRTITGRPTSRPELDDPPTLSVSGRTLSRSVRNACTPLATGKYVELLLITSAIEGRRAVVPRPHSLRKLRTACTGCASDASYSTACRSVGAGKFDFACGPADCGFDESGESGCGDGGAGGSVGPLESQLGPARPVRRRDRRGSRGPRELLRTTSRPAEMARRAMEVPIIPLPISPSVPCTAFSVRRRGCRLTA